MIDSGPVGPEPVYATVRVPQDLWLAYGKLYEELCVLDPEHRKEYPTLEADLALTLTSGIEQLRAVIEDLQREKA